MNIPKRKKVSTVNIILIAQLVVMLGLVLLVTKIVGKNTREDALEHMATISDERSRIIENYIADAERILSSYARAGQITDLLKDPDNAKLAAAAQKYTELFSGDIVQLEGIYASEWNTHVLTHTNAATVGMTTRPVNATDATELAAQKERLKQLQNAMLNAGNGVYNTGIIISPATGKQIVSMYKAVYDTETKLPIGLVGLGLYTDGLIDTLDNLEIRGISGSTYCLVNTEDFKYIFNTEKALVSKETQNEQIKTLCGDLRGSKEEASGNFTYKDDNNNTIISTYTYMKEYGWILMLDAPRSEVYALAINMRMFLMLFGLLILGTFIVFHIINQRQEAVNRKLSSQIVKTEKTKQSLTTAMFKDILTETGNRASFSMEVAKLLPEDDKTYYCILFNICDFSRINTQFGTDAGDTVLMNTAEALKRIFVGGTVYRTGSDEFVVVTQADRSSAGYTGIINNINTAHAVLLSPMDVATGNVTPQYKISVVKKSAELKASVISILKDMTMTAEAADFGDIQFTDLDTL